jgi:NAD(P)-dependent dehydrogenase (short-subunit alcohol dehydrogenase family)
MDLQLTGRRAVVTGGSRGIGRAIARELAHEGCDVGLVARDRTVLQAVAAELAAESGRKVVPLPADTGDDGSVVAMAADAIRLLGGVDILVNAAATANIGEPLREEDLEQELNIKLRGYLRCARAFAPGMAERGWGRIINISGLAARRSGTVTGSVRNVAVAAMAKNLADELGEQGINVTVVHPGTTRTDRTPQALRATAEARGITPEQVEQALVAEIGIGRLVTAEEIAHVVAFLASPLSVAINGDAIAVGGGQKGPIYY